MSYQLAFEKAGERKLVPQPYLEVGLQHARSREKKFTHLFDQRKWSDKGFDDLSIEILLKELSSMDSNNYTSKEGVGEREGRIFSSMVETRHYRMVHGIGRSGNLTESQPKATGSSIVASLANALVLDLIKSFVSREVKDAFILPMATGMSLVMVMLAIKPAKPEAKYVIWSRIDQKSCFKSMITAGFIPVIVQPLRGMIETEPDVLTTDIVGIRRKIEELGAANILCVLCTTSCFAPRGCDTLDAVARLCTASDVHHVVNNAYGVQSRECCRSIERARKVGRVDAFVQSTDKNLMVPVGGAIVSGFNEDLLKKIKENYPGRASSSQSVDVLITMLSMGKTGYLNLLAKRSSNYEYLCSSMAMVAENFKEKVILSCSNDISLGLSLETFVKCGHCGENCKKKSITEIGSMLFRRNVIGARVVEPGVPIEIMGYKMQGWGCHRSTYTTPYLTAAATVGMEKEEIDAFITKLMTALRMYKENGCKMLSLDTTCC